METGTYPWCLGLEAAFKSHHSGMETNLRSSWPAAGSGFKSHHSGMETGGLVIILGGPEALNRTIVGWKPGHRRTPFAGCSL